MSTKRPKLTQVGRQMGKDGHQEGPGGRKRGPSWSQVGPRWGRKEARWAPRLARKAQERPKLAPRAARKKGTQNLTIFGPLLGPVLKAFSCSRRSSEAFGWAPFSPRSRSKAHKKASALSERLSEAAHREVVSKGGSDTTRVPSPWICFWYPFGDGRESKSSDFVWDVCKKYCFGLEGQTSKNGAKIYPPNH